MRALLALSKGIDLFLKTLAHTGVWFFMACIITICFDVLSRRFGFQLMIAGIDLGSTRLQELEWHFAGIAFLTWLGWAYVKDAHVRIDVFTGHLSARKKAWMEIWGAIIFALPYLLVALPFAHAFFMTSFLQNESSSAPNGIPYRWIIKGFLYLGFWTVLLAVISVMARRIVFLFGSPELSREAMSESGKAA